MDFPASITGLSPALPNSKNGPYNFFHDQFASLYAWRNIGTSDYNALQVTYTFVGERTCRGSLTIRFRNRWMRRQRPSASVLMKELVGRATI